MIKRGRDRESDSRGMGRERERGCRGIERNREGERQIEREIESKKGRDEEREK